MSSGVGETNAKTSPLGHYATMLELAEQGLQVAVRGDLNELEPLSRRWEELVAAMPARPPAAAAPLLERAALLNEAARSQLLRLHETLMQDISLTARAGRAARGYAAQSAQRVRVDRCA